MPSSQKEPDCISQENTDISKDKSVFQEEQNTDENINDLKAIINNEDHNINNEAICVDFSIVHGEAE